MNCELISVGTELLLGDIVNTNAQYLSKELALLGIGVTHQCTVGDNRERLLSCLSLAFSRCSCAILTGGLGPTPDDITKEVAAEFFSMELIKDEKTEEDIKSYFLKKGTDMPLSNLKQALVPKGAMILQNLNGTAPGFIMEKEGKTIIVLPGPPIEMKPMFNSHVKPYLRKFSKGIIKSHTVRTFGIGESAMSEKVQNLLCKSNPTVAPYAKNGEALLRVTAKAETEEDAELIMKDTLSEIEKSLGDYIYGIDVSSTEEALSLCLKEKNMTVAFAESCTAGLCAKRLTDIPGTSQIFHCGVVSYSNEIKEKILGVSGKHLERFGAVSSVVAAEMALGVRNISDSSIGVGITGEAGPVSAENKPVGLIYIAVTDGENLLLKEFHGRFQGESCRDYNRFAAASTAFDSVRRFANMNETEKSQCLKIKDFIKNFPLSQE